MMHFTSFLPTSNASDFSNSARKSFTRQKQASLLGQSAPSTSYVDQIQTARRGQTTPIDSSHYISRDEVMTHPQDNSMLVAAQKKFQTLAGSDTNEFGVIGYRPTNVALKRKRNLDPTWESPRKFTPQGRFVDVYPQPKTNKLKLGNIVEGDNSSVDISKSIPNPRYEKEGSISAPLFRKAREAYYKPVFDMHSHPDMSANPSQADMHVAYENRKNNKNKYESLIYTGTDKKGGKNAPYAITDYKQNTPTLYSTNGVRNNSNGGKWEIYPRLGRQKYNATPEVYEPFPSESTVEIKLPR